jgi:hypothetical protein
MSLETSMVPTGEVDADETPNLATRAVPNAFATAGHRHDPLLLSFCS